MDARAPMAPVCRSPSRHLEKSCSTHAAADAHGYDHVFGAPALSLDEDVAGHARPAHAIGVADRNGAAIDVQLCRVDAELVAAIKNLNRKGLVQLEQIDVVQLKPEAFEKP